MKTRPWLILGGLTAMSMIVAACGGVTTAAPEGVLNETAPTQAPATLPATQPEAGQEPEEPGPSGVTVASRESALSQILVDGKGMTLYILTADPKGESTCSDGCARFWPPFTTEGEPQAAEGVDPSLLNTIKLDTGESQVTYNGMPLYYFSNDESPGDVNGQGVESNGGTWFVISPSAEAIKGAQAAPTEPDEGGGFDYDY